MVAHECGIRGDRSRDRAATFEAVMMSFAIHDVNHLQ